jgi:tetratricopeptide (TPR) repeat protein
MHVLLKRHSLRVGAIILLTLLVYMPAMRAGFVWDDDAFLTENPLIKADDGLYRFWFTTQHPDYFPLVSTSLWLEWRLWGMNATGYHVVNVVLHAVSSVLIWLVLRRLKIPGAWLAGLIFAVHPVNVESVAWITERKNTQPMVFYLLTILLYLRFERDGRRRWYFFALCSFLLALLSKTSVVMLPFVLLGCAWWQRGSIVRRDLVRAIPFLALSLLLGLVTLWFQYNVAIGKTVVRTDSFFSRLAGAGWAVWFYLYKAIIPYKLVFIYPRWQIDASSVVSYLPFTMLLGCLVLTWYYRGSWGKTFLFGMGYYVVTLFPVLGFFNIYFMRYSLVADHWQYFSLIGIIALAVGVGNYVWSQSRGVLRKLLTVATLVLVSLLCMLTWRQASVYTDVETLWRDTIFKDPKAWLAHNNLGVVLRQQGRLEEAMDHYYEVLRINPDFAEAHYNLGSVLADQGRPKEAIDRFYEALRINPDFAVAHNNLGVALMKQGNYDKAIVHYYEVLRINPDFAMAHYNLGAILKHLGRLEEAIGHYERAIQINPNDAMYHYKLGLAYSSKGRSNMAFKEMRLAKRLSSPGQWQRLLRQ